MNPVPANPVPRFIERSPCRHAWHGFNLVPRKLCPEAAEDAAEGAYTAGSTPVVEIRVQVRNREPQNASISTGNALKQPKTLEMRDRTPNGLDHCSTGAENGSG